MPNNPENIATPTIKLSEIVAPVAPQEAKTDAKQAKSGNNGDNGDLPAEMDNEQVDPEVDRIDLSKAINLRYFKGLDCTQIGKQFGVTKQAVHKALKRFDTLILKHGVEQAFNKYEHNILTTAKLKLLEQIVDPERLSNTSVKDASLSYEKLDKSLNLKEGKATSNVQHLNITPELEKALADYGEKRTREAIAEAHAEEALLDDEDY